MKYLSSGGIKHWLWPLTRHFFDVYTGNYVLLVEGVFDAWGFIRNGMPALCTFGKSMSRTQLEVLKNLQPKEVVFLWDLDAFGEMVKAVTRVGHLFPSVSVVDVADDAVPGKVDGGDALTKDWVMPFLTRKISTRMNVHSPEFFQWRMKKM